MQGKSPIGFLYDFVKPPSIAYDIGSSRTTGFLGTVDFPFVISQTFYRNVIKVEIGLLPCMGCVSVNVYQPVLHRSIRKIFRSFRIERAKWHVAVRTNSAVLISYNPPQWR